MPLEIFRKKTEGYKHNLSLDPPSVYVVLQDGEESDHDVILHLVSVCPYEAQDYLDSGEVMVDSVAMPDPEPEPGQDPQEPTEEVAETIDDPEAVPIDVETNELETPEAGSTAGAKDSDKLDDSGGPTA